MHARQLIDTDELVTLRLVEGWLGLVRRARGIADGSVGRLWNLILAGTGHGRPPSAGERVGRTPADAVWARLLELREAFTQLDLLLALEEVVAVAGGDLWPRNQIELAALKAGCAWIAAYLRQWEPSLLQTPSIRAKGECRLNNQRSREVPEYFPVRPADAVWPEADRYPLSPRIRMLRLILAKFGPMAPPPPPATPADTRRARPGMTAPRGLIFWLTATPRGGGTCA